MILDRMLPVTPLTIHEYLRKGKIWGRKIGKNWYVLKADLEAFLMVKIIRGEFIKKII